MDTEKPEPLLSTFGTIAHKWTLDQVQRDYAGPRIAQSSDSNSKSSFETYDSPEDQQFRTGLSVYRP